jgi:hypothetical protein
MAKVETEVRHCVGSEGFGIEPHLAPVTESPKQLRQKDGQGRMCGTRWNEYTAGLARAHHGSLAHRGG